MQEKSKRIAKNTMVLYIRMTVMMFINFYTVRIILDALGVDNYGIYNVVGGFVGMFGMISGSLSAACSRFINFALGKGDENYLKKVFSTEVSIQIALAAMVLILGETIGSWFLNSKMVIPAERLFAANCCFQFSMLNFCVELMQVPYSATIIAHERMNAFAYMSIYGAIMKLLITYLVFISPFDKLIFYAALLWINSQVVRAIYVVYCKRHFAECTFRFSYDRTLIKEIFSFSGWNFIGASSGVLRNQGNNILLNLFFGPSVNAARGIGNKIYNTAGGFVYNFIVAMNPQITQSYSSGDNEYLHKLIFKGARLSFYMMLFMAVPLIINANYILDIWLVEVPEEAVLFGQLSFVFALVKVLSNPLITAQLATGRIKKYQLIVGGLQMMNLPFSYVCLKLGCIPQCVVIVAICLEFICLAVRIIMLKGMIGLDIIAYVREVLLNVALVSTIAAPLPAIIGYHMDESFLRLLYTTVTGIVCSGVSILYVGCSQDERQLVMTKIQRAIKNKLIINDRNKKSC